MTLQPRSACVDRFLIAHATISVFIEDMEEKPSDRIIEQRIRNRIIEAIHTLAEADEGVRCVWPDEYFESFYDWIPHHEDGEMHPNSAITSEERAQLLEVRAILDEACDATPQTMTAEELIRTDWPTRIQPIARRAMSVLLTRGRYSEEREEDEPSQTSPWP